MDPYGQGGQQQQSSSSATVVCPPEYVKTVPGILKVVELVLCMLTFACSLGGYWESFGGGWVEFVAMSSFITTLIWFILHVLLTTLPGILLSRPYELITYLVMAALFIIAGIVAAARAPNLNGAVGATAVSIVQMAFYAFFAFACVVVYGIDAFFQFRDWNESRPSQQTTVTSTPARPDQY